MSNAAVWSSLDKTTAGKANSPSECLIPRRIGEKVTGGYRSGRMFVLVLASLCCSLIDGYHSFKVTKRRPFFVTLKDKVLIFALDELPHPGVTFTAIDNKNNTSPILIVRQ
jgi:hypothetical protein